MIKEVPTRRQVDSKLGWFLWVYNFGCPFQVPPFTLTERDKYAISSIYSLCHISYHTKVCL